MNDPDRTIENLLAGLRDAEPPPGMHHRILDAMVARQATAHSSRWPLRPALAISLACVLAVTMSLTGWVHHQPRPIILSSHTTNVDVQKMKTTQAVAHKTPNERVRLKPTHAREVAGPEEIQTAGFPAPPLPLTGQEKLLLRLAHRNDAQDMNLLNPDVQAEESANATQQFQQFFGINANEMRSESE
jgi:hypothetical protein